MSTVLSGVMAKVQAALPDQIGQNSRWDTTTVQSLIVAADRATKDLCEIHRGSVEISMVDDTISYDVATDFISIDKVEFSLDGTNYDWLLQPRSLVDLDRLSQSWRNDRSTRPDFYSLLSAPGVQEDSVGVVPSQILLYPSLATAGSATLRITGVVIPVGLQIINGVAPEDVQSKCHVPYVLSVLYAVESPRRAAEYYAQFKQGCESVRNRFRAQYAEHPSRSGGTQYSNIEPRTS